MKNNNFNAPLIGAIAFAAISVSGALIFLGSQLQNTKDPNILQAAPVINQAAIEKGIEAYIQKQQKTANETQKQKEQAAVQKAKNVRPIDSTDHVRGDRNATISLIEYSDFECPFCKKFHPTAQEFFEKNKGNVNWVYRHFPLGFHDPLSTKESEASECVSEQGGNEKFWAYADKIYERTTSNGRGLKDEDLLTIATDIGVDAQKLDECIKSEKYKKRVQKDIAEGSAAGVTGTPGNILRNNNTGEIRFIPGAYPLSALEQAMNDLL